MGYYSIHGVELDEDIMLEHVKASILGHSVSVATRGACSKTLELKRK